MENGNALKFDSASARRLGLIKKEAGWSEGVGDGSYRCARVSSVKPG